MFKKILNHINSMNEMDSLRIHMHSHTHMCVCVHVCVVDISQHFSNHPPQIMVSYTLQFVVWFTPRYQEWKWRSLSLYFQL
jgi:hypothetical protein